MRAVNDYYAGKYSQTRKGVAYDGTPYNYGTVIKFDSHNFSNIVTPGSIVQGNRKSPNAWKYDVLFFDYPRGSCLTRTEYTRQWDLTINEGQIGFYDYKSQDPFFTDLVFPNDLYNLCLSRFNDLARGTLDLAVDLAEAGQTVKMAKVITRFRAFASRRFIINVSRLLHKSNRRMARRVVRGMANARLEYEYGWKPLMSSLYGCIDESIRHTMSTLENFHARSSRPIGSKPSLVSVYSANIPGVAERHGRYLCEIKCQLRTKAFDLSRWTSLNPASLAYELTPYSFVLDWVINVGGYLRDLETSLMYANSFVSGYVTTGYACDATFSSSLTSVSTGYPRVTVVANASCSGRKISLTRSILGAYPAPRLPSFKVDLGADRLLNLAALLAQKL